MEYCDLHTRSTYSDGTFSPAQLVAEGLRKKLRAVALTDHNTVAGLPEFLKAAEGTGLEGIPGVEISTGYNNQEVHIVGLFLRQEHYGELERFLDVINQRKEKTNRDLVAALREAGYALNYEEIQERHQGNVNRAVIAAELIEKGYLTDRKEAFRGILSAKNGLYRPPERIPAFEAIRFLSSIHAVPVLAHPYLSLTEEALRTFLPEAKSSGLAAMETHYSTFTPQMTEAVRSLASAFDLLESGGSDFHGGNKPEIQLGSGKGDLAVPYSFVQSFAVVHSDE